MRRTQRKHQPIRLRYAQRVRCSACVCARPRPNFAAAWTRKLFHMLWLGRILFGRSQRQRREMERVILIQHRNSGSVGAWSVVVRRGRRSFDRHAFKTRKYSTMPGTLEPLSARFGGCNVGAKRTWSVGALPNGCWRPVMAPRSESLACTARRCRPAAPRTRSLP